MPDIQYTVQKNDSISSIAQRFYGDPAKAKSLFEFNRNRLRSGDINIIHVGEEILIPLEDKNQKEEIVPPDNADEDEVILTISGKNNYGWTSATITRAMDQPVDTFQVDLVYQNDIDGIPVAPFGYERVRVTIGKTIILNGRIDVLNVSFSGNSKTISIAGRSLAGIAIDSSIETRPLEWANLKVSELAKILVGPFGISVLVDADEGAAFELIQAEPGEKIIDLLNKLASQRGVFISSTNKGQLLIWEAEGEGPIQTLEEGDQILMTGSVTYNGQERFTQIVVDAQQRDGAGPIQGKATDSIVKDAGINRTLIVTPNETPEGVDLDTVAEWERGKRAASSMPVTVSVKGWRTDSGGLYTENKSVLITAPSLFIFKQTKMIIKSMTYNLTPDGRTTSLSLILPSAYTKNDVEVRPWQR